MLINKIQTIIIYDTKIRKLKIILNSNLQKRASKLQLYLQPLPIASITSSAPPPPRTFPNSPPHWHICPVKSGTIMVTGLIIMNVKFNRIKMSPPYHQRNATFDEHYIYNIFSIFCWIFFSFLGKCIICVCSIGQSTITSEYLTHLNSLTHPMPASPHIRQAAQ